MLHASLTQERYNLLPGKEPEIVPGGEGVSLRYPSSSPSPLPLAVISYLLKQQGLHQRLSSLRQNGIRNQVEQTCLYHFVPAECLHQHEILSDPLAQQRDQLRVNGGKSRCVHLQEGGGAVAFPLCLVGRWAVPAYALGLGHRCLRDWHPQLEPPQPQPHEPQYPTKLLCQTASR